MVGLLVDELDHCWLFYEEEMCVWADFSLKRLDLTALSHIVPFLLQLVCNDWADMDYFEEQLGN